jgi:predicted NBD/HSP70 family sugar kinase
MIVGQNAPVDCSCGNRDCWEAFASERAAVARYLRNSHAVEGERAGIAFDEVVERALGGEPAAIDALTETAHFLGIGISNLIVGLSPETVVVGGQITRAWPIILPSLEETIGRSIRRGLPSARIVASTLSEPTLMGSISLVLASKFGLAEA